MTNYPYSQNTMLVNNIIATTVVEIDCGMQVSTTTFTSPVGDIGKIVLSPVQTNASNIEFKLGLQTLQIGNIYFISKFGFACGQVMVSGNVTDQDGENIIDFSTQIATWS
jgi:hypothetical protein